LSRSEHDSAALLHSAFTEEKRMLILHDGKLTLVPDSALRMPETAVAEGFPFPTDKILQSFMDATTAAVLITSKMRGSESTSPTVVKRISAIAIVLNMSNMAMEADLAFKTLEGILPDITHVTRLVLLIGKLSLYYHIGDDDDKSWFELDRCKVKLYLIGVHLKRLVLIKKTSERGYCDEVYARYFLERPPAGRCPLAACVIPLSNAADWEWISSPARLDNIRLLELQGGLVRKFTPYGNSFAPIILPNEPVIHCRVQIAPDGSCYEEPDLPPDLV